MKRKKIILLFLAIMMSLLLIFNQSAHSSADDTSQTAAAVGRDRSAEVSADEVEIQFTNKDTKLEAKTNVVGNGHGSAFPSFEININLSKLSSPGGKDKDHAEDQTDYPKTNDFDRLKEGDFILIPIPKEVQLRDYFFANKDNPFFLEEDVNGKKFAMQL